MKKIYLDYAATTPVDPQVLKSMIPYFRKFFGNPLSIHSFGQIANKALENARESVAHLIKAELEEIVFTSSGTESNNMAIKGIFYALQRLPVNIITSSIEHSAILEPCKFLQERGVKVTYLSPDKHGLIDPRDLHKAIDSKTILVSIMHANNEIGTIQPIKNMGAFIEAERIKRHGIKNNLPIYFHTDAVQTAGHIPINVNELKVDLLSMSGHKLYGPKGVGALYIKNGVKIVPLLHGGEQERNKRGSTQNVSGIVGFGVACEIAEKYIEKETKNLIQLRNYFIEQITNKIKSVELNGHPTERLPNNVNLIIKGVEGEAVLISLDMMGIAVSSGSACSTTSLKPSHVLLEIGLSAEEAHSCLRFSLGKWTKKKDIDYTVKKIIPIVKRLRKIF